MTDPFLPGECYASQEREHYLCLSAPRRVKTGHIMSYTHLPPFKNRTFVSIQMERKSSIKERTELALDKLWRISFQAPAPAVRWGQPRGRMNGAWVSLSPALGGRQLGRARHCATGKNTLITDLSSLANPSSSASTAPLITFFIPLSPFTTEGGGGSQQPWSKVISKALSRRWPPGRNGPQRRRARPLFASSPGNVEDGPQTDFLLFGEQKKFPLPPSPPPLSGWCYGELLALGPPRFTRPRRRFSTGAKIYEEGRVFLL